MASVAPVDPVKVFAAVLYREPAALAEVRGLLAARVGEIDLQGPDHPFAVTDYYEAEMGPGLLRRIVSFRDLAPPESLVDLKLRTNGIEDETRGPAGRRANIDIGFLDVHKVVLASAKFGPPKVHLGRGIYADLALRYSKGAFHPYPWTFADFRGGTYDRELLEIRRLYKEALRGDGPRASP